MRHIETCRARWLTRSRLVALQDRSNACENMFESTGGTKKQLKQFLPFCSHRKKNGDKHLAYELNLGVSVPAQFEFCFSLQAQNEYAFIDHNDVYL